MVEGSPSREEVVRAVTAAGVVKVRLIPLMLVAGTHFIEDLCDGGDSWQAAFTGAGLEVTVTPRGIGRSEAVVDIFIDHIREALDIIPGSDREATGLVDHEPQKTPAPLGVPGEVR